MADTERGQQERNSNSNSNSNSCFGINPYFEDPELPALEDLEVPVGEVEVQVKMFNDIFQINKFKKVALLVMVSFYLYKGRVTRVF
jgi:hypothetical protein